MAISYSKKQLIERIQRHLNNGFPDTDFKTSSNEILLYIDEAIASDLVGRVYDGAKVEGTLAVPEAYYITYQLPALTLNTITGKWETTLPQPPVSLPLGHSISDIYFASGQNGVSISAIPIKSKRVAMRNNMPRPSGIFYKIEGSKLIMESSNGQPLLGQQPYATMASTRTNNINDTMNLPDDAISNVFNAVVNRLKDRMMLPIDIIKDNLPAGNKSS